MTTPYGLTVTLPRDVTDTGYAWEYLRDDSLLSAGSLVLLEPGHPAKKVATLPASGATFPNLAWKEAKELIGSGTESSLACGFTTSITGLDGKIELSSKGGLHAAMSSTRTLDSGKYMVVRPPQAVVDYVVANPNHSYYVSAAFRMTKFADPGSGTVLPMWTLKAAPYSHNSELLFNLMSSSGASEDYPSTGKRLGGRRSLASSWRTSVTPALAGTTSPIFANIAVSGYTGTPQATGSTALSGFKMFGAGASQPQFTLSSNPSALLYWAYVEDLTVSGRTYAQVDALDCARYQAYVTTSGGRYYGDTYTDPTTIT